MCLDVCGLAANLYRRNTPVIKVGLQPMCGPCMGADQTAQPLIDRLVPWAA